MELLRQEQERKAQAVSPGPLCCGIFRVLSLRILVPCQAQAQWQQRMMVRPCIVAVSDPHPADGILVLQGPTSHMQYGAYGAQDWYPPQPYVNLPHHQQSYQQYYQPPLGQGLQRGPPAPQGPPMNGWMSHPPSGHGPTGRTGGGAGQGHYPAPTPAPMPTPVPSGEQGAAPMDMEVSAMASSGSSTDSIR
jgi:hypothetical protein